MNSVRLIILLLLLGMAAGCSGADPKIGTAKDFIGAYAEAWRGKNVERILAMSMWVGFADSAQTDPLEKAAIDSAADADERTELEDDLTREGLGYQMWTNTAYESETDHGDHIHVKVTVDQARTDIVLVRDGGTLKIHPNPSSFTE